MVDTVLKKPDDEKLLAGIKEEVKEFMQQFPLYPELG
jgi:glycine hydroxymethyltransferase